MSNLLREWRGRGRGPSLSNVLDAPVPRLRSAPFLPALLAALCALVAVGLLPSTASAHSGKQSYLYVSVFERGVEGRVEIPVVDLGRALGVDFSQDPAGLVDAVLASRDDMERYVSSHTTLGDGAVEWTIDYRDISVLPTENGPYAVLDFVVEDDFDEAPRTFVADFAVIIEFDPERDALLIIEDDFQSAVFDNGEEPLLGFSVGLTEQRVELGDESTLSSMAEIRGMGSDAVRTGIDLLLLVAASTVLLLLVPATRGETSPTSVRALAARGRSGLGWFAGLSAVGLWISGLGALTPSPRPAGLIVAGALAVVAVALVVTLLRPSTRGAGRLVVAVAGACFGLGLGASFFAQDLDRSRPVVSLIAFQVGAWIAALFVVVFVAVPLLMLRRTRFVTVIGVVLGAIFAGYAVAWIGELIVDGDWPVEKVANPLRVWPRNVWFVALAVAAAAGVRTIEQRAGRLRSVDSAPAAAVDPSDSLDPVRT